jgi:cytochrome P450
MLQAVVKEATRLLPSIVFQLLRHTPENFVVRGEHIPAGTSVGISPISQNRDRDIFGEDANEFRPERWLENRDKAGYMDTCLMTFGGSGPRMCVGKNIALVRWTAEPFMNCMLIYVRPLGRDAQIPCTIHL